MSKYLRSLFLFLLVLSALNFFDLKILAESSIRYFRYTYLILSIGISMFYFLQIKGGFSLSIQLITISVFISIIFAYFFWNQSWSDSILATIPFMLWPIFFYLKHLKYSIENIERLIVIFGIIYMILYIFQFLNSDTVYFGSNDEFDLRRGTARIIIPGSGLLILTIFISLSKFSLNNQYRWCWFVLFFIGLTIVILQVTRQYIALVLLLTLFHFTKSQNFFKKVFIISIAIVLVFYVFQSENKIVKGLKSKQQETFMEGKDYIRIQSGIYFLTQFSPSKLNYVFGNGVPLWGKSDYGIFVKGLNNFSYFDMSDVGLNGLYVQFGVLSVLGYLLIWVKSFTFKLPANYYYLKYYLWFLLFSCLTSAAIYATSFLITNVLVLYCFQIAHENEERRSKKMLL